MLEAIAAIERYLGRTAFEQDELRQGWFVRNLQIVGEAARGLPEAIRALGPEIPWPQIIGMRNVLVHGYFFSRRTRAEAGARKAPEAGGGSRAVTGPETSGAAGYSAG